MKKTIFLKYSVFILLVLLITSCKKNEDNGSIVEALFSYTNDGFTVTFTDTSTGVSGDYLWDFGDGTTSAEQTATIVHTYSQKGRYVFTLYRDNKKYEASTIIYLDKSSPVRLDDGTLSDWDAVTKNVVISGANGMGARMGKFDYDANYIYFYIEQAGSIADGTIMDLYIDTDADRNTGFQIGAFTLTGAEIMLEGQVQVEDKWFDCYKYAGTGADWNFSYVQVNEFYKAGDIEEKDGKTMYEFAVSRSKISGLTGNAIRIGINIMDSGWSDFGFIPDKGSEGFLLDLNEQ
jgi:PKD repeat protein